MPLNLLPYPLSFLDQLQHTEPCQPERYEAITTAIQLVDGHIRDLVIQDLAELAALTGDDLRVGRVAVARAYARTIRARQQEEQSMQSMSTLFRLVIGLDDAARDRANSICRVSSP